MRGRWGSRAGYALAGSAILLLAYWLRDPLIPYGANTPRASDFSLDSARVQDAARRRVEAIRSVSAAIRAAEARLGVIARSALRAPTAPRLAFDHLRAILSRPEDGVTLFVQGSPFAWRGQLRSHPQSAPGTSTIFDPFYTALQVVEQEGERVAVATTLIHAEAPANRVATALDETLNGRDLVESFRFAPLSDTLPGAAVAGSGNRALLRVDAVPLSLERIRLARSAVTRARGTILIGLAILLLMAVAWADRRSLAPRLFSVAIALYAIALIPWNNFSNFARAFDPAYFYSPIAGPFTANAGVFAMFGALFLLAVIALIRAGKVRMSRPLSAAGAIALIVGGLVLTRALSRGISLPQWGSTASLWVSWQVPLFLILFGCWLAAMWLARISAGRRPIVQLRTAALVAVISGAVATFIVWTTTTEQRLQLAMRDVAGLQRIDSDATLLLGRFASQLAAYDAPGDRADLLKRYASSDLPPAEVQVSLSSWTSNGERLGRVDLAELPFDSTALSAAVAEAVATGEPVIRQTLGPVGRQVILAVPHRDGGVTSAVASPRTRLVTQNPFAALLGFEQPGQTEPPYSLILADVAPGAMGSGGTMTWRRQGNEWHGDELIGTSRGVARAHVEVDIRTWPTRLVRASLIVILNVALGGILWALGAMAEGGFFRWLTARTRRWARSYRGRLTLVLFTFFVVPAITFATWSYQRLRGDERGVRELLVRETLQTAAGDEPAVPQIANASSRTPLLLYSNGMLASSSDSLYEMIAPAGRLLPPPVHLNIANGGELTATWQQTLVRSRILWGYRAASSIQRQSYVLAAPARSDDLVLDRRRRDLTLLVLFATAVGAIAAFWLSGIAARILARDLELSRIEVARAERILAWGEMARQVAHEIKNPLTPIRLGVQHLRRARSDPRIDFDRVLDENVRRILSEIDRLDEIARAFSRYGSAPADLPAAEQVDVAAILRDVVGLEKMGIDGISWTLLGAEQPLPAQARADELRDVLLNVFENARLARAKNVRVTVARQERTATIEIADDGAGIARAALPRVFEPHFSTRTTGSGLGLAISRRLLESWNGTIDLESDEGKGARVVITLQTAAA